MKLRIQYLQLHNYCSVTFKSVSVLNSCITTVSSVNVSICNDRHIALYTIGSRGVRFEIMGNFTSSALWIVVFVAFIKGQKAGNITTTKHTVYENCNFPSVDIASITIATFVCVMMRCATECSFNVQCTGYLLKTGELFITIFDYIIHVLCYQTWVYWHSDWDECCIIRYDHNNCFWHQMWIKHHQLYIHRSY